MAPRTIESRDAFLQRLEREVASGAVEIRFGSHHFTHAVCREDGMWRVRRLECSQADAEAFMAEHGMFMPENAEDLARPTTLVHEASALDDLRTWFRAAAWPM